MRLLDLRFGNLNSLAGKWAIDFTAPEYVSNGIFAITGPTGAGKSTILDALCLALYGRTPRLKTISMTTNEIMSRQTGECFAEATFETREGRFLCRWSQHRAYRKPGGNLVDARHEIARADTGEILEEKKSRVPGIVEEKTGMDFDRFTRSVLLAQGGFAAFLQASADQRAPILEEITGTGIYSAISMHVHERRREELSSLDVLEERARGIRFLASDEEAALSREFEEKEALEKHFAEKAADLSLKIAWLDRVRSLETEIRDLDVEDEAVTNRVQAFLPDRERLETALAAAELDGVHATLLSLREEQSEDDVEQKKLEEILPEKQRFARAMETDMRRAADRLEDARKEKQLALPEIRAVRALDVEIREKRRIIKEMDSDLDVLLTKITGVNSEQASLEIEHKEISRKKDDTDAFLEANRQDASLAGDLSGIRARLVALNRSRAAMERSLASLKREQEDLESGAGLLEKRQVACRSLESELQAVREKKTANREAYDSLLEGQSLKEIRQEIDSQAKRLTALEGVADTLASVTDTQARLDEAGTNVNELEKELRGLDGSIAAAKEEKKFQEREARHLETEVALRRTIRDYEQDRLKLENGKPCPLCGALEHPFASGNVPELTHAEKELRKAAAALEKTRDRLAELLVKQAGAAAGLKEKKERVRELGDALEAFMQRMASQARDAGLPPGDIPAGIAREKDRTTQELKTRKIIVEKAELLEAQGVILSAESEKVGEALLAAKNDRDTVERGILEKKAAAARTESEWRSREKETAEFEENLLASLSPYGMSTLPDKNLKRLEKFLEERAGKWNRLNAEAGALEKQGHDLTARLETLKALIHTYNDTLAEGRVRRKAESSRLMALEAERRERFGDKDTDHEEKRLDRVVQSAEEALDAAGKAAEQSRQALTRTGDRLAELSRSKDLRGRKLLDVERTFRKQASSRGFDTEEAFLAARLPSELRARLAETAKTLEKSRASVKARMEQVRQALEREKEKNMTGKDRETLEALLAETVRERTENSQAAGAVRQRLEDNIEARKSHADLLAAIENQKIETGRWEMLHSLIGSADGKRYRNFVQGLTFEIMVSHANRQLAKMTDRYLLVRDAAMPLELNVVDNYQAGEIRTTKNLSGGEAFIVSLALALGLSHMAGRRVRVDSLFLDEGFGTLDEEALETALETLAGLQRDGKIIGVISHVPQLRERISTRISVEPDSGGRSLLSGPGCRRVN